MNLFKSVGLFVVVIVIVGTDSSNSIAAVQDAATRHHSARPMLAKASLPRYPRLAKLAGMTAILDFEMLLNGRGRVKSIRRIGATSPVRGSIEILWEYVEELVRGEWVFVGDEKPGAGQVRAQFVFDLLPPQTHGDCREPHLYIELDPLLRVVLTDYRIRAQ